MAWVEVFVVFVVSHLGGDYLFQTDWQATHKRRGLGRDRVARRALLAHVATYTIAFAPALIWLSGRVGAGALWVAALIAGPHLVQDDGRLVAWWIGHVKGGHIHEHPFVAVAVDQTMHVIALLAVALAAAA